MNITDLFAKNLKRLRKQRGLTQEQLSKKSRLHRTYIGGIEQGRINVSLKNIEKIANALSVNPAFFFIENDSHPKEKASLIPKEPPLIVTSPDTGIPLCADAPETTYYLCAQEGRTLSAFPIESDNPDLTIQILCSLIQQGYQPTELYEAYAKTKKELVDFLNSEDGKLLTHKLHS